MSCVESGISDENAFVYFMVLIGERFFFLLFC